MLALIRAFTLRLKAVLYRGPPAPDEPACDRGEGIDPSTVPATCHSDDYLHEVQFDAAPWFEQAGDEDILALAATGWGGDYPADEVARFMEDRDDDVAALFGYLARRPTLANGDTVGFECHVEAEAALGWLQERRPGLFTQVCALAEEVPRGQV